MKTSILLMCCVGLLVAQSKPDVGTNVNQAVVDYYDSISDYFRQSPRAVELIAKKGIPDQEIPAVLLIARKSSASPNQVIEARKSGKEFGEIAKSHRVTLAGNDFAAEANIVFLSEYHGRSAEEIRALHAKGAGFIDINQQYRRVGVRPKTEKPAVR